MKNQHVPIVIFTIILSSICSVYSCSGGGSGGQQQKTHKVSGVVSSLTGTGLILQNNSGDDLHIISNGSFAFSTALSTGATYSVTVKTHPVVPNQTCTASNNTGTISNIDITDVSVVCSTNTYSVGGVVSGLTGTDLIFQNNGIDDLIINSNGTFTFAAPLADGSGYNVTVSNQPYRQTCLVSNGTGTLNGTNITSVAVDCPVTYETVYVSMRNAGVISVLDSYTTITTSTTITYGHPVGLAADFELKKIYATNYDDNTVSVIDTLTNAVVSTIPVGINPESLGVNPTNHSIYVSNFSGASVSVITYSAGTYTVSKTIPMENAPCGFAINTLTNKIYIPDFLNAVSVIDAISSTVTGTIDTSGQPAGVAVDAEKKRLYVSGSSGTIDIINTDTNTITKQIGIGGIGHQIVVDPASNRAYATSDAGYVAVIDTTVGSEAVLKNITCGTHPHRVAISTAMKRLYVTNRTSQDVTIIDIANDTVIDTIPVSGSPDGVAVLSP